MKGRITVIKEIVNEMGILMGYEMIIESKDKIDLQLGDCEVKNE